MTAYPTNALEVACPFCGAAAGAKCHSRFTHAKRLQALAKAQYEANPDRALGKVRA